MTLIRLRNLLIIGTLIALVATTAAAGPLAGPTSAPAPAPTPPHDDDHEDGDHEDEDDDDEDEDDRPGNGNGHGNGNGNPNDDKDDCDTDGNAGKGDDHLCEDEDEEEPDDDDTDAKVGFGKRKITPVGPPPAEWAQFFTPQPKTGAWGEPFTDLDNDGCYDPGLEVNAPPKIEGPREPHVDQPWNSTGDTNQNGAFSVRGVTIMGDPLSTGKWDGVWANAGFGSKCTEGMHDDTWARAMVMELDGKTVAMVSLDVVGFFNYEVRQARKELKRRYPDMKIDELVVSSTHTHEAVDTMGYWGENLGIDGKFPAYQAFIRSQMIDAIHDAYNEREKAFVKFGKTELTMGIRDSRPPHVIDPWLLSAQFIATDGSTIGTLVNWSNHPEAQGSKNALVSSDFPHGTREVLEQTLGGTAVYFSGSVGGLMTPLGVDIPGFGKEPSWERTYEIGRLVAKAAIDSLAGAPVIGLHEMTAQRREMTFDADNNALRALNTAGVFDLPSYAGAESWGSDPAKHRQGVFAGPAGPQFRTEMVAVQFGPALFLTVPGELFPELELGGYGRPDCPAADTGRPYEPVISEQYDEEFQFILGLGQDELGYIVPGYDFWLKYLPENNPDGSGLIPLGALEAEDPCGEGHYEETVSGSSVFAPWVTCVAAELAGRDPWATEPACSYENTHVAPYGVGGHPSGQQPRRSHGHSHGHGHQH